MPEPKSTLTKLATGRNLFALFVANRQTLWLADDHLVLEITTGYTERVRRFYFADIQSIAYARTAVGAVISILCATAAALLVFLGLWNISDLGLYGGLFITALSLLPLAGLAANVIAGPTCACVFSTAVHTERVLALNRIPKAERVLGQILPRIDAAQGRLSAEMLAADQPEAESVEAGLHALEGNAGRVELRHETGGFHRATYAFCLVFAVSHAVDIFVESAVKNIFDGLLLAALVISALVALRRQNNSDLSVSVKNLSVVVLMLTGVSFFGSMFLGIYFFTLNPERAITGSMMPMPRDSMATQVFLVFCTIAFALVGVMGLMRLGRAGVVSPVAEKVFTSPPAAQDDSD